MRMRWWWLAVVGALLARTTVHAVCDPAVNSTFTPKHNFTKGGINQCNWHIPYRTFIDEVDNKVATTDYANDYSQQQVLTGGLKMPTGASNDYTLIMDANG